MPVYGRHLAFSQPVTLRPFIFSSLHHNRLNNTMSTAWDIDNVHLFLQAYMGKHTVLTFAYSDPTKCDYKFFDCLSHRGAITEVEVDGAPLAYRVDLTLLHQSTDKEIHLERNDAFYELSCPKQPPTYRSLAAPGALPCLQAAAPPDDSVQLTDFSRQSAKRQKTTPAPQGTPKFRMFTRAGIQVCTKDLIQQCYCVQHPENESSLGVFIDLKRCMAAAQRAHKDQQHGAPTLALSCDTDLLAAAILKVEKNGIKLVTPENQYVWLGMHSASPWQKIDGGRGHELVTRRTRSVVIKSFEVADTSSGCMNAAARPVDVLELKAVVVETGMCFAYGAVGPAYEVAMLALATAHVTMMG